MNIRWTDNAARNLETIRASIAEDAQGEAERVIGDLLRAPRQLETFPLTKTIVEAQLVLSTAAGGGPTVRDDADEVMKRTQRMNGCR